VIDLIIFNEFQKSNTSNGFDYVSLGDVVDY
jgi:hypothetical protein